MPPMDFRYVQCKITYSPAIKVSSWIRNILVNEVIIYPGVECNIMAETAIQNTRRLVLAMINALMSLHYDLLLVPDAKGDPIIIQAQRYLGYYEWEEKQLVKSEVSALNTVSLEDFLSECLKCITKNQSGTKKTRKSTYELYNDEIGPGYLNQKDYLSSEIENPIRVNLSMWKEVMQATSTDFVKHIVPILIYSIGYSIKALVNSEVHNLEAVYLYDIYKGNSNRGKNYKLFKSIILYGG
jgi:hypothetical protein